MLRRRRRHLTGFTATAHVRPRSLARSPGTPSEVGRVEEPKSSIALAEKEPKSSIALADPPARPPSHKRSEGRGGRPPQPRGAAGIRGEHGAEADRRGPSEAAGGEA